MSLDKNLNSQLFWSEIESDSVKEIHEQFL